MSRSFHTRLSPLSTRKCIIKMSEVTMDKTTEGRSGADESPVDKPIKVTTTMCDAAIMYVLSAFFTFSCLPLIFDTELIMSSALSSPVDQVYPYRPSLRQKFTPGRAEIWIHRLASFLVSLLARTRPSMRSKALASVILVSLL